MLRCYARGVPTPPDAYDDHDPESVVLHHADGRRWIGRHEKSRTLLQLRFPDNPDVLKRTVSDGDRRWDALLEELRLDGFVPTPEPAATLERWLSSWHDRAPSFDATALYEEVRRDPDALSWTQLVLDLREPLRRVTATSYEVMRSDEWNAAGPARAALERDFDRAWKVLILGLRSASSTAVTRLDEMIALRGGEEVVPALVAMIGEPASRQPYRSIAVHTLPRYLDRFELPLRSEHFATRLGAIIPLAYACHLPPVEQFLFSHLPAVLTETEIENLAFAAIRTRNPIHRARLERWEQEATSKYLRDAMRRCLTSLTSPSS